MIIFVGKGGAVLLLRRLEAYGFKSFAEKTELEFGHGITAIVGPNGSGKSNISDAIRWTLGEQSIRTLRGAKLEDVIFAGSTNRRPMGVAEVSLIFDNSDGYLPLDFNEVIMTRRVFRSGDSEYYINKRPCRLKDIHDLLADTGLGRESMTVIGQNKVDEILSSKPEERRLLLEEAAGIIKYKHRKREALRKLDDTEQNLTRVFDITLELEAQLAPLKESSDRTQEYNRLNSELKSYQATLLLTRIEKAEKMLQAVSLEQVNLTDRDVAITTKITAFDNKRDELSVSLGDLDGQISDTNSLVSNITLEVKQAESRMGILSERIEQGLKGKERIISDTTRLTLERTAIETKIREARSVLIEKQQLASSMGKALAESIHSNEQLFAKVKKAEIDITERKDQSLGYLQELIDERNSLRMHERDLLSLAGRKENLLKEQLNYVRQQEEFWRVKTQLQAEAELIASRLRESKGHNETLNKSANELECEINRVTYEEQDISNKLHETNSRLRVLSSMQDELEGFGRAIKSVLGSQLKWRSGICGAVAQLFIVPEKYVTAIEIALGGALQHLVTIDDDTATQAIEFLKTHNLGRATFLPLNTIKPLKARESELQAARCEGALGIAAHIIDTDESFRPVVEFLLGRVVITNTIEDALRISRKSGFSVKFVTLAGELVNPGGALTGGSTGRKDASYFSRKNQIEKLKQSLSILANSLANVKQKKERYAVKLSEIKLQQASTNNENKELELRQAEVMVRLEKVEADDKRFSLALTTISSELAEYELDIGICQKNITETKANIELLERRDSEHKAHIDEQQKKFGILRQEQQELHESITDLKVKLSSINQEITNNNDTCRQLEESQQALSVQIARLNRESGQLVDEIDETKVELNGLLKSKEELLTKKLELERVYERLYSSKLNVLADLQRIDKDIKDLRRQESEVKNRLHESQLMNAKYSYEASNCKEQLGQQLALTIEEACEIRRSEQTDIILTSITKLSSQITALGPINSNAIDEYLRVSERYSFLQGQMQDLVSAKDYLTSVIKEIDSKMSRQFNVAFKAINGYFGDVFTQLFGGGRAELLLIEPENVLDSGIDIIVQPPGKKLQNLALLSGGERALTVIALLFAILTYRPSPFCVVDEIDAALDEANVRRFSEFLRDYAQKTQFIIVTHRKGTMEAADVMHGVTMEESGISRLISVKFMDKAG